LLVAADPDQAKRDAEDRRLAAGPAVKGVVALGDESRVVIQFNDERLRVFYVVEIVNSARVPVNPGGPFVMDLPAEARAATLLQGSTKQATVIGARVMVTGPFTPGSTTLQIAYEILFDSHRARLVQSWPA